MKHQDSRFPSFGLQLQQPGNQLSFWRPQVATLMRAFMLILLGAVLLPGIGSAQSATMTIEQWRQNLKQTLPAEAGCYQATYSDTNTSTNWQKYTGSCGATSSPIPAPEGLGGESLRQIGAKDGSRHYVATAVGGPISSAEGSFSSASNETVLNAPYSLQITSNLFKSNDICTTSISCLGGAKQFGYMDRVYTDASGKITSSNASVALVYYVLYPDFSCSSLQMIENTGGCQSYINMRIPHRPFNTKMSIYGQSAGDMDTVILFDGNEAFAEKAKPPSAFNQFSKFWQDAEFNVFGLSYNTQDVVSGITAESIAQFAAGSKMVVTTNVNNGTRSQPTCKLSSGADTAEGNNLNYNSPCCAVGGDNPHITFSESTDSGKTASCVSLGGTEWYTITPIVSDSDKDKVIAYFADIPFPSGTSSQNMPFLARSGMLASIIFETKPGYEGYRVSSVSGTCGGQLTNGDNASIYMTNSITGDCTVIPTYTYSQTQTSSTVTLTTITPSGSARPAAGVAVPVSANGYATFTITPPAEVNNVSFYTGGGCGTITKVSPWYSNLVLKVGPVTSNCTFSAAFSSK
jgi:hypothetical protein